jgi:Holliday junction resolvase RusA-like endonuclease
MLYKVFNIPLDIPIRPHGKGRPRFWNNRTLTPKADRDFERALREMTYNNPEVIAARENHPDYFRFNDPNLEIVHIYLGVEFNYARGKKRPGFKNTRPDIDNLIKAFLDALNGVLWPDDALVTSCSAYKLWGETDRINGGITIGYRIKTAKEGEQ